MISVNKFQKMDFGGHRKQQMSSYRVYLKVNEAQIKFRQVVLKQECEDKTAFTFFQNKRQFSSSKLYNNLHKLFSDSHPSKVEVIANPQLLVGVTIQHCFEDEDGTLTWCEGLVVGQIDDTELFVVLYFGEDEICESELIDDLRNQDLVFL